MASSKITLKKRETSPRARLVAQIRAISREALADVARTGSDAQRREMSKECGYPDEVTLEAICNLYDREGVAKRVVQVYPVETWKNFPEVYETEKDDVTEFEKGFRNFVNRYNLWSMLERADILSGLGYFGIILIGIKDGRTLESPVKGMEEKSTGYDLDGYRPEKAIGSYEISYFKVYDQRQVTIDKIETDTKSPRYGRPVLYTIKMSSLDESGQITTAGFREEKVHWHRVIHLCDLRESSDVIGTPRLRTAYNRVQDLLKVIGGSAEMFWKGGFPGLSFEIQPGLQLQGVNSSDFDIDAFREEVANYANGLQRYLRLIGLTAKSLAPQVADPTPHVHAGLDQICITINCPKRIFLGTESAHLASTQDQKVWTDRINARRMNYAAPYLIRPLVMRLILLGAVPFVTDFLISWKDPEEVDPLIRSQSLEKIVNAMAQYATSGLATLIPPKTFLTDFVLLDNEHADRILEMASKYTKDKNRLPLVQADDQKKMEETKIKLTSKNKATKNGPNGPKAGTGKRREIKDVSTGQKGG